LNTARLKLLQDFNLAVFKVSDQQTRQTVGTDQTSTEQDTD